MTTPRFRQGRSVVLVNGAISVLIIVVIAGVSVFRQPATPPTLAEFAPANPARQLAGEPTIPPQQQRRKGQGSAGPMAAPRKVPGVPSSLQCWSWPDGSTTQTFDRKSPPCIAAWNPDAGNGGATWRGVSRTEVRVGIPAASVRAWQPYADFFSTHYQLYGRTIRLVPLGLQQLGDAEGQRAAASAAAERSVFAALDDPTMKGQYSTDLGVYLDTLAGKRVLGVITGSTQVSTTALGAQAPYAWSYQPAMDTQQRILAGVVCRELTGHRATYAKQTEGQNRRFAVLVPAPKANSGRRFDTSPLSTGLERCQVAGPVHEYDPGDRLGLQHILARARADATTTLITFGGAAAVAGSLMPAAEAIGFRPEWLIPGFPEQQSSIAWSRAPAEQVRSLFGLAAWDRPLPESRRPAVRALREVAPRASFGSADQAVYDGLALIASGVQLAGPRLTPQAFADGLATTTFANPGAGSAPDYQARVGFDDLDHSMVDDFAQIWWRDDRFCMVGGGRRWTADEMPYADPGFFQRDAGC